MKTDRKFACITSDFEEERSEVLSLDDALKLYKSSYMWVAVVELGEDENIMRYIKTDAEYMIESCPHCGHDSLVKTEFRVYYCVDCGKEILPCGMCDSDYCNCKECPLKGKNRFKLAGI